MLNEFAYCPRLFYLEWVQGEWSESADTLEGTLRHRRVDKESGEVPKAEEAGLEGMPEVIHARSVMISSEGIGMIARIDLLEGEGRRVSPVQYKRGSPNPQGTAWEPEQVQLCAEGLILRGNGYDVDSGVVYFAETRQRVTILFTEELVNRTLHLLRELREMAASSSIPAPLADSPKCPRCSLVGICLPDEVGMLAAQEPAQDAEVKPEVRRLFPARDDALPLYVQDQGAMVRKEGDLLKIVSGGKLSETARLMDISQVGLFGNVQISTQALRELCTRGIPLSYFSYGGWFYGTVSGLMHKNVELRRLQYAAAEDPQRSLALARRFVQAKILNCRTLLRRNHVDPPKDALRDLARFAAQARKAEAKESLLGIEGMAARIYYSHFAGMLKHREDNGYSFQFENRNRRPPKDPVNALLSFAYAILAKDLIAVLQSIGFDPYFGFYHSLKYGRPALALDMMEEFRPLIGDSVVIGVINNGEIRPSDFVTRAGFAALKDGARKTFLQAYCRRMDCLITHPVFLYRISYRRTLEVQARLLGRYLSGEIEKYPLFLTR
ncbi:MAG: CRISPR-associated endonuclease Cas1 [Armatimonadetes bacterium]|nr:CRISPR-associated endonuclease Cas1 [Armatimonadota bacterium]